MEKRIQLYELEPEAFKALLGLEKYMGTTALSNTHKELIKIRASQLNGCAFCINMHTEEARKQGETEQRIYLLNAWRDTNLFTEEEQAILALTEEITMIHQRVSDATYQRAAQLFEENYLAQIIMMIVTINAWNRVSVATETKVG